MTDTPITDEEVIKVMMDGGRQLCQHAKAQWTTNKYGMDADTNYANYRRWDAIERRISDLGHEFKSAKRNQR